MDDCKWDRQHQKIYRHLRDEDEIELLKKLLRYRNAKADPHLAQYPPDIIEKTIYVIERILTDELGIEDIEQAIADARKRGEI